MKLCYMCHVLEKKTDDQNITINADKTCRSKYVPKHICKLRIIFNERATHVIPYTY